MDMWIWYTRTNNVKNRTTNIWPLMSMLLPKHVRMKSYSYYTVSGPPFMFHRKKKNIKVHIKVHTYKHNSTRSLAVFCIRYNLICMLVVVHKIQHECVVMCANISHSVTDKIFYDMLIRHLFGLNVCESCIILWIFQVSYAAAETSVLRC